MDERIGGSGGGGNRNSQPAVTVIISGFYDFLFSFLVRRVSASCARITNVAPKKAAKQMKTYYYYYYENVGVKLLMERPYERESTGAIRLGSR